MQTLMSSAAMTNRPIGTALLLLTLMLAPAAAISAESWYQVEMIVFTHKGASLNSEHWPDDPGRPNGRGAIPLRHASGGTGPSAPKGGAAYTLLDDTAFQLNDEYAKLRRSGRYEPVLHLAWKQPATRRSKTRPVALTSRRSAGRPPRIEGVIRISKQRYLHADVDLILTRPVAPGQAPAADGGFGPAYRSYRMHAKKRMRSGKLYYLDHPLMGVLIKITPLKPPAPAKTSQPAVKPSVRDAAMTPN